MNAHAKTRELAARWLVRLDRGLSPHEEAQFNQWRQVEGNAQAFAEQEKSWRRFDVPRERCQGEPVAREIATRLSRRRIRTTALAGAIAALAIAGIAWQRFPSSAGKTEFPNSIVVTAPSETLPDGTRVERKPGTGISTAFTTRERRVVMAMGEAHFDVRPDPQRPFIVDVGGIEVRAVGTAFAIDARTESVTVLVTQGVVAVESGEPNPRPQATPAAAEAEKKKTILVPAGRRASVRRNETTTVLDPQPVTPFEAQQQLAWRGTRLEFSATPLAEAVALMNRYSKEKISLADPSLGQLEISGYFNADNLEGFIDLVQRSFDLAAERRGDRITLARVR